jgi:addiction module HigA family antidote
MSFCQQTYIEMMYSPPIHPGEVVRLVLERGHTQDELAGAMRVSRYSINQLVNAKRRVTPAMALRLSRATSTSVEFWLNLQRGWDLHFARQALGDRLSKVRVVC